MVESGNGEGFFCFFEDDGETGYFYLYEPDGQGVIDHLHIFSRPVQFDLGAKDVEVLWSQDGTKCALKLWNNVYGIFDLATNQKFSVSVKNKNTPPIDKAELLDGFM